MDGSLQLMKEVEEVKLKKKQAEEEYHALIPRHAVQQQKLKACEVSHSHTHNLILYISELYIGMYGSGSNDCLLHIV